MSDGVDVEVRIRQLLSQVLEVPEGGIDPAFSTETNAAWTSLNHLMLISQIESEFNIAFSNREIREATSFGAIVRTVNEHLGFGG